MNKEQHELLDEAYALYLNESRIYNYPESFIVSKEEFINKCKTNPEFSETWGLKIEERELNDDELNIANLFKQTSNKLITITYNDKTIESYE